MIQALIHFFKKSSQTGGLSLRIKTRLTQAFPLPHTPRGSSSLWARLALHLPSLRRKLINARAGDSFHERFLSYFQIFYYLKIYLQTHDVPKRIVQSCCPLYLKRPDWSTVYIKMLLSTGLPQRNGCIEVY